MKSNYIAIKRSFIAYTLVLFSVLIFIGCSKQISDSSRQTADMIQIEEPQPNAIIKSPFLVHGQARGTWYFEAGFPVRLLDDKAHEIAATPAQAQGEWMIEDFVPFTATLEFHTTAKTGILILQKDNPSGLPEYDDELRIPVRF